MGLNDPLFLLFRRLNCNKIFPKQTKRFLDMPEIKKAIIYARVSSKEQEKEGYSIPAQLKLLNDYAYSNGVLVVKEYVDVETAKKAGRANFKEMISFLQSHDDVKTVLVEKTDRLYRNFKDYVTLEDLDLDIHLVKEGETLNRNSRSHVKFIHGVKLLMAKNYIDNLSEEVKKGMREKVAQGGFPNKAPIGYFNNKETRRVEIDNQKAFYIKEIFELYATGKYSLNILREKCLKDGFVTRKSEKRISKSNLEYLLKNVFYTGHFRWCGDVHKGTHEPIISGELFNKAQEAFKIHNKPVKKGIGKKEFAFGNLLKCGHCGLSITAEIKKNKYIYYRCTGFRGKCGQPYVREEDLRRKFGNVVKAIQIGEEKLEWLREALKMSHLDEKAYHGKKIKELQARYNKFQNRIDQAYVDKLDKKISEDFWLVKTQDWKKDQEDVALRLKAHQNANMNYMWDGLKIMELAEKAYALFMKQDAFEQARLLKIILSNCDLNDGNPCPTYSKPFDLFAENSKKKKWLGD